MSCTPRTTPARTAHRRSRLWPAGVHIAPYLSPAGRFVIVAIGKPNYRMVAAEVTGLAGHRRDGGGKDGISSLGHSTSILEPQATQDGMIPLLNPRNAGLRGRALKALLWSRGVHLAPWYGAYHCGKLGFGRPMIAVDSQHRLVAEMMVPGSDRDGRIVADADVVAVRQHLLAILESVEESAAAVSSG